MKIRMRKIADLIPASKASAGYDNPRKSSADETHEVRTSLERFGFVDPVIVNTFEGRENIIVGGHLRVKTWGEMGNSSVPTVDVCLDIDGEKELNNRLNKNTGSWDVEKLLNEFSDDDLVDWGWTDKELKDMHAELDGIGKPKGGEDPGPGEPPKDPKTELGRIYQLGKHRLMCGDSTCEKTVALLMDGKKADMVFTDPPYGVSYEGGHNTKKRKQIENDALAGDELTDLFADSLNQACSFTHNHAPFYIWFAGGKSVETFGSFAKLPLSVRAVIAWYKVSSGLGAFMSQYIPNYEPCIYAHKTGKSIKWYGPTDEKTVWELKRDSANDYHPTQKPIELPVRAIGNSSKCGDIILDLFGGSGSTLIACQNTRRACRMMELDPKYCDVIVERYCNMTDQDPQAVYDTGIAE